MEKEIKEARKAVDKYRADHEKIYKDDDKNKDIKKKHLEILKTLIAELTALGFVSIEEFFEESMSLNLSELGFSSMEELAATVSTDQELDAILNTKWR